jgi:hypothetical protein
MVDAAADAAPAPVPPAPVPRRLYVHDDLTDEVGEHHGPASPAAALVRELLALVRRDPERVVVLTLHEQLEAVLARGRHPPFALTLGIARAGERVARQLHARAGWFPVVRRLDVTREEDGPDEYRLVSPSGVPLAEQLRGVETAPSIAVVDDTIFSGLTMRSVLGALPATARAHAHAFCLRCVAETLPSIETLCPVTAGFAAAGRILEDVSFINASGLVRRVAIRRAGLPPLAFFERREWMLAWFPGYADDVVALCRRLNALLEPAGASTSPAA